MTDSTLPFPFNAFRPLHALINGVQRVLKTFETDFVNFTHNAQIDDRFVLNETLSGYVCEKEWTR